MGPGRSRRLSERLKFLPVSCRIYLGKICKSLFLKQLQNPALKSVSCPSLIPLKYTDNLLKGMPLAPEESKSGIVPQPGYWRHALQT
jgi:hypothetical protein